MLAAFPRMRGPQKAPTKVPVSIRLSPEVVEHFKSQGPGWQSRIDAALKKAAGLQRTLLHRHVQRQRHHVLERGLPGLGVDRGAG